jgi:hypothetical protein
MSPTEGESAASPPPETEAPPRRKRIPKVAKVAGLVLLAVGLVTAVALAIRYDDGGRSTTTTTSSSPPSSKGQIQFSCLVMTNSSTDAINTLNVYVDTFNANGDQQAQQEQASAAVGALDASARRVEQTFGPMLPQPLRDVLNGYTRAAREVSGAVSQRVSEEAFNAAVDRLNTTKNVALDQCDALS